MTRGPRIAIAAALLASLALTIGAAAGAPAASALHRERRAGAPAIELVEQAPFVARDGQLLMRVDVRGAPTGATLRLALHDRVLSRAELVRTFDEGALTETLHRTAAVPLGDLPRASDGSRTLALPIRSDGPADPARVALRREGTYPVDVLLADEAGEVVASLLTYLVLLPPDGDESPPLAVSLLAELGVAPGVQPSGEAELDRDAIEQMEAVASALADRGDVPVTLAPTPETLDALAAVGDGDGPTAQAARRALAAIVDAGESAALLARPYVDVDVEALVDSGLQRELDAQLSAGVFAGAAAMERTPSASTWLADETFDVDALRTMTDRGVERVVLGSRRVAPLPDDTVDPDRWFLVSDGTRSIPAVEADPDLARHLAADDGAALGTQRWVAEAAALWFERPAIDRGVAVVLPPDLDAGALALLLDALDGARLFRPVRAEGFFDIVDPLDPDGGADEPLVRELAPAPITDLGDLPGQLQVARSELASYTSIVGDEPERVAPLDQRLLVSQSRALPPAGRTEMVQSVLDAVRADTDAVTTPGRVTVTLTARDGTIPLTLRNETGHPVKVRVLLDSDKLEFPDGEAVDVTLVGRTTRLDVRVRTRATGAFPLDIEVRSPDGRLVMATARYSVRSTAVSGVGLVLSVGAGLFLALWWARHWRDARRSRRLLAADQVPKHLPHPHAHTEP